MNKTELRRKYKKIRSGVKNKRELSRQITNKILSSQEYINAETICLYVSFEEEVDTWAIIKNALESEKIVGVPIVHETNINFYKINSIKEINRKNAFGIKEPAENKENLIAPESINLIIVPGICFDLDNNRLGFGKGYYDKYLSNKEIAATKIGLCFREQILQNGFIDVDTSDIKMDRVIYD
ncbi:MAG: 5-formyltetrahydrofolate cyclo-ligase [Candidatus Nomurabacteria bacterium]|jgi:5-formyltetrahydrofolate cyclo-ligase|nr:5-formyltetrahydrofolate cyclo-ligase [Candidatus Nomurabacteria bacterium]